MNERERYGDVSFILLLVPFIASTLYAVVLWAEKGVSLLLPDSVYLQVTKDPYLFLLGFVSVMIACILEVTGRPSEQRTARVATLSRNIQSLAVLSVVLSLLAAWYANGFDVRGAVFDLLEGRFSIVFPTLLILFSFLVLPSARLNRGQVRTLSVIVCFLAVPAVVYEVGKRNTPAGLALALVLIVVGTLIAMRREKQQKT